MKYEVIKDKEGVPVKAWIKGVPFEEEAKKQLLNVAKLPFIHKWVSAMPDVHLGKGATIGSVIPTVNAVIPAAVGVDLGCGMMAVKTSLRAKDLPLNLKEIRSKLEASIPVGRACYNKGDSRGGAGSLPDFHINQWNGQLKSRFDLLLEKLPHLDKSNHYNQLGTLGGGNHFIEICLDELQDVWVMLHSGSRGIGNSIGRHYISQAKSDMEKWMINLPDSDLAYLPEGSEHFKDYLEAVNWAQDYARINRECMMFNVLKVLKGESSLPPFEVNLEVVNCHHNYISQEHHYGKNVFVTRKGAVRAREGDLGIIPGSMGAKSYIVEGLGNKESFCSCSHGAGRAMSRTAAKKHFNLEDHKKATDGVECRKDENVIDETPGAYKDIDAVMEAQSDLVTVKYTLKQILCIKG